MASYADRLLAPPEAPAPARSGGYAERLLGDVPQASPDIEVLSSGATGAGVGANAAASFIDDLNAQARYFAEQRGIPIERYRVADGNIIYQGDDGKWYRERPAAGLSDIILDPSRVAQSIAGGAGASLPIAAGAAGGIASAPMLLAGPAGMLGSMGITGAAAAGGEALKDAIGSAISGESQMDLRSPALEGGAASLGQGIGAGLTGFATRKAARDIARIDRPAATALKAKADAQGIPLTAAELTNLRSLKGQQTALGNIPRSGEVMDDFYTARGEKIGGAVTRFLDDVSPIDSAELAGQRAVRAASAARQGLRETQKRAASPLFKAAEAAGKSVDVSDALAYVDDQLANAKGPGRQALLNVRQMLMRPGTETLDDTVAGLHRTKIAIDKTLRNAPKDPSSADNFILGDLTQVKQKVTTALRKIPEYDQAAKAFARAGKPLDEFDESVVASLLKLKDAKARDAAAKLFSPSQVGPKTAFNARTILEGQDPEAWQAIKRAFLEDVWQKSQPRAVVDAIPDRAGAVFRQRVLGDPKQAQILRQVLDNREWAALNDLGEVLEATGRVVRRNSHTAFMQEAVGDLRTEARGAVGGAVRAAANPFAAIREKIDEVMLGGHAEKLAQAITDPEALTKLRQIKMLPPNSARFRAAAGQFLAQYGFLTGEEALSLSGGAPQPIQPRQPQGLPQ